MRALPETPVAYASSRSLPVDSGGLERASVPELAGESRDVLLSLPRGRGAPRGAGVGGGLEGEPWLGEC